MDKVELRIEDYVKDGHERFMNTPMIQDAVMRNLEVIGEETKRLSDGLKQENPDIPWKQMAGLRDILIHGYRKVALPRVWNVIEQNLPFLKERVKGLLDRLDHA